ncbi:tRNA pseudouridine(13) synthase TruD [Celerinatantimonas sp. YJH-8]|uniref:tRNA pseudouridine(13) synthase TruD n=1 Tax=Celerinatantimonas sp. YJH-8 TaxID=3228714 RepID=UPI0038C5AD30
MTELAYLSATPVVTALFKQQVEDFQVVEVLPFSPSGEGEHWLLEIEKRGENTVWVAEQLARLFKVAVGVVSYAGLKDRQGITRQWFSVQQPKNDPIPDFKSLPKSLAVLQISRHNRKLRRGALSHNEFSIRLRQVSDIAALEQRLQWLSQHGVPNYFGPQRFGHHGQNLEQARAMFAGKRIKNKSKRSLYLSAARSFVFNQLVSARINAGLADTLMTGDCLMLQGKHSFFVADPITDEITKRLAEGDVQISAPLVGDGDLTCSKEALSFEKQQLEPYADWVDGLAKARLSQERRPLLVRPMQLQWQTESENNMWMHFNLPPGCYATSILRELVNIPFEESK